jgi:hypothetical protein
MWTKLAFLLTEGEKHLPFFSYTMKHKSAFFLAEALPLEPKQLSVLLWYDDDDPTNV